MKALNIEWNTKSQHQWPYQFRTNQMTLISGIFLCEPNSKGRRYGKPVQLLQLCIHAPRHMNLQHVTIKQCNHLVMNNSLRMMDIASGPTCAYTPHAGSICSIRVIVFSSNISRVWNASTAAPMSCLSYIDMLKLLFNTCSYSHL